MRILSDAKNSFCPFSGFLIPSLLFFMWPMCFSRCKHLAQYDRPPLPECSLPDWVKWGLLSQEHLSVGPGCRHIVTAPSYVSPVRIECMYGTSSGKVVGLRINLSFYWTMCSSLLTIRLFPPFAKSKVCLLFSFLTSSVYVIKKHSI